MASHETSRTVKEAVGVFFDPETLERAIDDLRSSGFQRTDLGVLADERTVTQRLDHLYARVTDSKGDPDKPPVDWIREESMGDAVHGLLGGVIFAGAATAAGTVIATVGLLGGAVLTAGVGAAAVGGLGAVLAAIIAKSDAEYLQEQVDRGHLLLFVRTRDSAGENRAIGILSKHSPFEARVYKLKVPEAQES